MHSAHVCLCPATTAVSGVPSNDPLMKLRAGGDRVLESRVFISSALIARAKCTCERAQRCAPKPHSKPSMVAKPGPRPWSALKPQASAPDRCPLLSTLFNVRPSAAGLYDFYSLSLSFAHVAVALTETSVHRAVSSPVYWVRCGMD